MTFATKYYPLAASVVFSLCSVAGLAFSSMPAVSTAIVGAGPFSVLGGFFGWYYLRFLNKNRDQTVGDVSDEFALVVLLPDFCTYVTQSQTVNRPSFCVG
ncbi:hypothetical protein BBJ28_00001483 [Nothophytophthora sp. Chile5]|nr:hypothetical protein BBJ28_00001483 [Nothophytophthora sp. Chile5]